MKTILVVFVIVCSIFLRSSNTPTPQKYLDKTVLNSGKVAGFAGDALSMELEHPPVKTNGIAMTRTELIEARIGSSEKILNDLHYLLPTPDSRDIVTSSIAMHEFVLEVYKTDYLELARLYDEGASKETLDAFDRAIKNKHASMFELHYENLLRGGRLYASKHHINVNWRQI